MWAFLLVTPASASQTVRLKVAFDPDKAGARTTIRFGFHIFGPNGAPPSAVMSLGLRLPAGMGLATTTLGQANCYPKALMEKGLAGCSENARLGFGDAVAEVPMRHDPISERASLTALMGPPAPDQLQVLLYAEGLTPVFAQFVFPGLLREDTAPFGDRIDTEIPLVEAWPEGPDLVLTSFTSTIGPLHLTYHRMVSGRRIAYEPHGLAIPKRCPPGGFPFGTVLAFADGSTTRSVAYVPCPK
jgi:hypothetical protein